jgi:hypothetical protein
VFKSVSSGGTSLRKEGVPEFPSIDSNIRGFSVVPYEDGGKTTIFRSFWRRVRGGTFFQKGLPQITSLKAKRYQTLGAAILFVAVLASGCPHINSGLPPSVRLPPLEPTLPAMGVYHTVQQRENLGGIATTYEIEPQQLAEMNNLRPPYVINESSTVFVPGASQVKPVDVNKAAPSSAPRVEEFPSLLSWPVEGRVVSEFGVRDGLQHNGIVIGAPVGAPVKAAAEGKVGYVGQIWGRGKVILIEHPNRLVTVYAHLGEIRATEGKLVKRAEIIGTVGNSGREDSPSLYFEVTLRSNPRNPLFFLPRGV